MDSTSMSFSSLWLYGDPLSRAVMLLLLLMSLLSWCVLLIRGLHLWRLQRPGRAAMQQFWHCQSFSDAVLALKQHRPDNPFQRLAVEGADAVEHHRLHTSDLHGHLPLTDWLSACLRGSIEDSMEGLNRGLAILASVAATAPFLGLFGTVWGIYQALISISASGQVALDKIAGPVGEALLTTAAGLVVAIPALLGYNALSRANRGVHSKLNRFAHQLHAYFLTGAAPLQRKQAHLREVH
ncbi:MotA/TolQ/ExbB proton channel family protein [Alkalimonas sp. MEB108]|uniref:Biopolymer transport protein ExbB n=1 Tax=Alkalimonas cellulosilytica TaxID=3058395 RepID=A0ABU7J2U1_9GAMM|nr:MotA/TolQ/ExbB proton channel family protein [Alkalimonas sp. MEB108]MEE2000819.1 MotA/TolQ/ExbB proton channel family protein [Alkalimonas sp. MEB108]